MQTTTTTTTTTEATTQIAQPSQKSIHDTLFWATRTISTYCLTKHEDRQLGKAELEKIISAPGIYHDNSIDIYKLTEAFKTVLDNDKMAKIYHPGQDIRTIDITERLKYTDDTFRLLQDKLMTKTKYPENLYLISTHDTKPEILDKQLVYFNITPVNSDEEIITITPETQEEFGITGIDENKVPEVLKKVDEIVKNLDNRNMNIFQKINYLFKKDNENNGFDEIFQAYSQKIERPKKEFFSYKVFMSKSKTYRCVLDILLLDDENAENVYTIPVFKDYCKYHSTQTLQNNDRKLTNQQIINKYPEIFKYNAENLHLYKKIDQALDKIFKCINTFMYIIINSFKGIRKHITGQHGMTAAYNIFYNIGYTNIDGLNSISVYNKDQENFLRILEICLGITGLQFDFDEKESIFSQEQDSGKNIFGEGARAAAPVHPEFDGEDDDNEYYHTGFNINFTYNKKKEHILWLDVQTKFYKFHYKLGTDRNPSKIYINIVPSNDDQLILPSVAEFYNKDTMEDSIKYSEPDLSADAYENFKNFAACNIYSRNKTVTLNIVKKAYQFMKGLETIDINKITFTEPTDKNSLEEALNYKNYITIINDSKRTSLAHRAPMLTFGITKSLKQYIVKQ